MCQDGKNSNCNGSSFIFGLFLGLLVAGLAAVVLYRKDRGEVLAKLQKKLKDLLRENLPSTPKPEAKKKVIAPPAPKAKPKLFRKAK